MSLRSLNVRGRTKASLKLITEDMGRGPLSPHSLVEPPPPGQTDEWTVLDELRSKHPEGKPANLNVPHTVVCRTGTWE